MVCTWILRKNTNCQNLLLNLRAWRMLSRNLPLLVSLGNQFDGDFPIAGVNGACYTGEFVYINLEITAPPLLPGQGPQAG